MEVFEGTVRLADDTVALPAVLLVGDDRLRVTSEKHELGDWRLTDISATVQPDGCHVVVEGEELVVSVPETIAFAEAIGRRWTNPGNGSLLNAGRPAEADKAPSRIRHRLVSIWSRVPAPARALAVGAALVIALAVLAPLVLIALVLVGALASLLVGSFALMDPFLAVRLPDPLTPQFLIKAGLAGVALAIVMAVVL